VIIRKSPAEIDAMAAAGAILVRTLQLVERQVRPGVTTAELDEVAEKYIRSQGAVPTFKGYRGFPGSICASPNSMIVHGIPGSYKVANGDILSIDVGVTLDGWVADAARTVSVGPPSAIVAHLLESTERSLHCGIEQCVLGNRLGDVSHAIQASVEAEGLSVVRALVGHGVGRDMHEDPQIPNYGEPGTGPRLQEGMVLAIEPMITTGSPEVRAGGDGWAIYSKDGSLAAHFEFTVAITAEGPRILTPWHRADEGGAPVANIGGRARVS
jgi:methionyl aminopeptidase